jgi:hypothetical protein
MLKPNNTLVKLAAAAWAAFVPLHSAQQQQQQEVRIRRDMRPNERENKGTLLAAADVGSRGGWVIVYYIVGWVGQWVARAKDARVASPISQYSRPRLANDLFLHILARMKSIWARAFYCFFRLHSHLRK